MRFYYNTDICDWVGIPGYLDELEEGDCITYESRNTYYCVGKEDEVLTLKKCYTGNVSKISPRTFKKTEIIKVNMIDRDDIQDIYRDNLISHTQGIFVVKMTKASFIYRFIADIDLEIKPGESKKLKWGRMEVLVKKTSKDNSLKWYVDGKVVDEETIKLMIGYFNNSPQELRFIRTKETKDKWVFDDYFYYELMDLYRNINYPDMFDKIEEYVKENKGDVTVEVDVFVPDRKGNYMPHKFSFVYEAASDETKLYHYPGGKEFDFCDLIGVYILCTEYNKNYRF